MAVSLIFVFITIALLEMPKLIKEKLWREFIVFLGFFFLAFTISFLMAVGVKVPSPTAWMEYFVKEVLHLNYS